ncbi:unnamed protein product [Ilex paraguariensis]|uniref:Protein kinase domain-containing protein n=1 Tax=Ilex paraguariensis TaxID=185542 RepID=A0ABC8R431_9AQUA
MPYSFVTSNQGSGNGVSITAPDKKTKAKRPSLPSVGLFHPRISYQELLNVTGGFSLGKLTGSGSVVAVYRGTLNPEGTTVPIKVLKLNQRGASKSFMAECRALSNIRHHNLVRILLTACLSTYFEQNDFKALVFEFMPNGSFENWLHLEDGQIQTRILNLLWRINITLNVASALHYLHQQTESPVVHCDIGDNDFAAHPSDFGLARLLPKSGIDVVLSQFSSAGVMATTGYILSNFLFLNEELHFVRKAATIS